MDLSEIYDADAAAVTEKTKHIHEVSTSGQPTRGGVVWEGCRCGATRQVRRGVAGEWHTCEACTHEWGMEPKKRRGCD